MHDFVIKRISSASLNLHLILGTDPPDPTVTRLWDVIDELDAAIRHIREAMFPA